MISCWLGHVEIARALLNKGAPVSAKDNDGRHVPGKIFYQDS
jgi:hypothetical protein